MEEKFINWVKQPVVIRSLYVASCMVISFALGIVSEFYLINRGNDPIVQIPEKPIPLAYQYKSPIARNPMDMVPATETTGPSTDQVKGETTLSDSQQFTASKSGKIYYPAGCAGINRIKVENRIYFATEKEAEEKGYTRSASCK